MLDAVLDRRFLARHRKGEGQEASASLRSVVTLTNSRDKISSRDGVERFLWGLRLARKQALCVPSSAAPTSSAPLDKVPMPKNQLVVGVNWGPVDALRSGHVRKRS